MATKSAFAKKVKKALVTPPSEDVLPGAHEWRTILGEFAQSLSTEPFDLVRAGVVRGSAPGVYRLVLWPMSRRDERVTMLVVHFLGGMGRVLGKDIIELKKREDFEEFLIAYARLPSFRHSLEELQQRATEDSEGYLRTGYPATRDPRGDVLVRVPGEQQIALAKAAETKHTRSSRSTGQALTTIHVFAEGPRTIAEGIYNSQEKYAWLVSSGFALAIHAHRQNGTKIEIEGEATTLSKVSDLDKPGIKRA